MRDDLEQEEQLAAVKAFWRANRAWILALAWAVLLGVAGYQGWSLWQSHQGQKASSLLLAVEEALGGQDLEKAQALGKTLEADHAGSDQHVLAAFRLAKAHAAANQLEQAAQWLGPAVNAKDPGLAWMARLRLSAVLIDQDDLPKALSVLEGEPPASFAAQVDDRRGDILALQDQASQAKAAWAKALQQLGGEPPKSALADLVARKIASIDAFSASEGQGKAP